MFPKYFMYYFRRPMEEREQDILVKSGEVFMRYGIKSVTMDDVASKLGISKKTLYQFVSNKDELVFKCIEVLSDRDQKVIDGICAMDVNAIDQNFEISKYLVSMMRKLHPSIHFDLQKYHPEAWARLQSIKQENIHRCTVDNINKGIKEGLYRDDLNPQVISKIYLSRFDVIFDGELFPFPEFSFTDVIWELFRYHIRGIANGKGVEYLKKKVQKERTQL